MDIMNKLRKLVKGEEIDYVFLSSVLSEYKYPRNKINSLLKQGALTRVKKGLYVFGEEYSRRPYSKELLANLIYGPSYISLDYALYYYGAIPERVELVTSTTCKKVKTFQTPVGDFSYKAMSSKRYQEGICVKKLDSDRSFLIATPEKALADKLLFSHKIQNIEDLKRYILDNLRIEMSFIKSLNLNQLKTIATIHGHNVNVLCEFIKGLK